MVRTIATTHTRPGRACQNIISRHQHTADLAALLRLDRDQLRDVELTDKQWSGLIARWNWMAEDTRRAHRRQCVQQGHKLVSLSARRGCGARVCIACLEYRRREPEARASLAGYC